MRGQQAQRAPERVRSQCLLQTDPARQQRAMRVHDSLRISGRPGGEQDQCFVVEREARGSVRCPGDRRRADVGRDDTLDAGVGESAADGGVDRRMPQRHARFRGRRQVDDLERGQRRVERGDRRAEAPQRQEVGEEFEAVTVVNEDPVAVSHAVVTIGGHPEKDFMRDRRRLGFAARQRLDQISRYNIGEHQVRFCHAVWGIHAR